MNLSETWFVEGHIDFELQKYRLLAYLREVSKCFNETKLYPQLSDVIFHYNNLNAFRANKQFLQDQFPRSLDQVNMARLELIYEQMLSDDDIMQELERITSFSMDEMKRTIDNGAEIYELVERQLRIEPVGIVPLYKNEGYMLLRYGQHAEIRAYSYTITLFERQDARYKGVRMNYVDSWQGSIVQTYEMVKRDIIRKHKDLPNPAVYSIETGLKVPVNETLLPIAKRMLVRYIEMEG